MAYISVVEPALMHIMKIKATSNSTTVLNILLQYNTNKKKIFAKEWFTQKN